jgi:hypothetical protein
MDKIEDSQTPSAEPQTAGDPIGPAPTPPAGLGAKPAGEPKGEPAHVASPTIAPVTIEAAAEAPAREAHAAAESFERTQPRRPHGAAAAPRDIIPLAAPAAGSASRKLSKFALLAASLVLASALGAMAGVLGAARLAPLFGSETASAPEPSSLEIAIGQLRSDIAALKSSVDTTTRTTGAQFGKLVERLDRAERAQSAAPKADAALPKETTGAITTPSAAATPLTPAPLPSPTPPGAAASGTTVPGWAVRDVYRGVALLQSRMHGMVEVEPGDLLPGLGRIESIRRQDGRWVVMTSKGMITSMR